MALHQAIRYLPQSCPINETRLSLTIYLLIQCATSGDDRQQPPQSGVISVRVLHEYRTRRIPKGF